MKIEIVKTTVIEVSESEKEKLVRIVENWRDNNVQISESSPTMIFAAKLVDALDGNDL